ncbi:MAG: acetolactate synthase large subunit [Chloroflexota bacterium]|nr:acetolactate synthase large subunit [Chloroflexota bacterium]
MQDTPERATPDEPRSGADLFFQAALRYGYQYVFGNPGTTEAAFMDALVRYPDLRFILCLHENVATGAADGVARLTGRPALVNLHLAPGLSNGLANIHNARRARVPMVVTVGQHDTRHLLEDSPLHGDIEGISRGVCKWIWTVQDAGELAAALHRATMLAMQPPQGPVCLILPTNILTALPRTPAGAIPSIPALQLPERGPASAGSIARAAEMLRAARHPVILIGDTTPAGLEHIRTLATLSGAQLIHDTFPRRVDGRTPGSTRLPYFPAQRRQVLSEADVLFLVGVGGFTTLFLYANDPAPIIAATTQVIHLDDEADELGKNARDSLPLYGDIPASLALLVSALQERLPETGQEKIDAAHTARASQPPAQTPAETDLLGMVMRTVNRFLPEGAILVDEAITSGPTVVTELLDAGNAVHTHLTSRGGALGAALPLSIGAQLGAPGRQVVAVVGDGSAMYAIQALWSTAHYKLPILTIICNNGSYDIIKLEILRLQATLAREERTALNAVAGFDEPRIDFAHLAQGLGVHSWSVREMADIEPAVKAALETCSSGSPALIDVHIQSHFM